MTSKKLSAVREWAAGCMRPTAVGGRAELIARYRTSATELPLTQVRGVTSGSL
jgi:hypothetical protein